MTKNYHSLPKKTQHAIVKKAAQISCDEQNKLRDEVAKMKKSISEIIVHKEVKELEQNAKELAENKREFDKANFDEKSVFEAVQKERKIWFEGEKKLKARHKEQLKELIRWVKQHDNHFIYDGDLLAKLKSMQKEGLGWI